VSFLRQVFARLASATGLPVLAGVIPFGHRLEMLEKKPVRVIKSLLFGVFIGCLVGLWLGINIGQEKPLFSNPLPESEEGI